MQAMTMARQTTTTAEMILHRTLPRVGLHIAWKMVTLQIKEKTQKLKTHLDVWHVLAYSLFGIFVRIICW